MIKTVVRNFKWEPKIINEMYCDDEDFFGLDYWYKDIQQQHAEIEANKKK